MNTIAVPPAAPALRPGPARRLSDLLYTRRGLLLLALLAPPLLWFGVIYLGSLLALLANAFFRLDDFTGQVVREVGLSNFVALLEPANLDAARRTVLKTFGRVRQVEIRIKLRGGLAWRALR